jgi:hypothetical protein
VREPRQPVTDFNEYTYHFIEVVHTHLNFTKGAPPAAPVAGAGFGGAALGGAAGASYGAQGVPGAYGAPAGAYGAPAATGTGSLEQLVLTFFQSKGEGSDMGATISAAVDALQNNGATEAQVRATPRRSPRRSPHAT